MNTTIRMLNNKGAAFIGVLIVMVVLSVTSIAFFDVSLFEGKSSIKSEKTTQAYHYAQTAALVAADYLIINRKEDAVKAQYGAGNNFTIINKSLAEGNALVNVEGLDDDSMLVTSTWTAEIGGTDYQETVKLVLEKGLPPFNVGKYGIQAKSTVESNGTSYTAETNIASWDGGNMTVDPPFQVYGQDDLGNYDDYMNSFPEIKSWPDPYTGNERGGISGTAHVIDSDDVSSGTFPNHLLINGDVSLSGNNASLTFVTNDELFIKVDGDFTLTGQGNKDASLVLIGNGPIHILVEGSLDLGGNAVNELGEDISPENFVFYVPYNSADPNRSVTISGNSRVTGVIVAPDLEMTTSGNPHFEGISFVESFSGSGTFSYTQNPIPDDLFDSGFFDWPLQITAYTK